MRTIIPILTLLNAQSTSIQSPVQKINEVNSKLLPVLHELVETSVFRYFKANLNKECEFWREDLLCTLQDCSVQPAAEKEIPDEWKMEALSEVNYKQNGFGLIRQCVQNEQDFCLMDDEDIDGVYINLLVNPERYTGYAGESAARVWSSIYNENCFDIQRIGTAEGLISKGQCNEKQVFYKLISGLHTSISMHICGEWLDRSTGEWIKNATCYAQRIQWHPDRVDNLYFLWSVTVRAVSKLLPFLQNYPFCDGAADHNVRGLIDQVISEISSLPPTFDETQLFVDAPFRVY